MCVCERMSVCVRIYAMCIKSHTHPPPSPPSPHPPTHSQPQPQPQSQTIYIHTCICIIYTTNPTKLTPKTHIFPSNPPNFSAETFYKNNPGLQGAVNKTSELLLPTLEAGTLQYALLLNSTHSTIKVGCGRWDAIFFFTLLYFIFLYVCVCVYDIYTID